MSNKDTNPKPNNTMTAITTTTTTTSTMNLGHALRVITRAGLPTTFSKKRKSKKVDSLGSIKVHLDQHLLGYANGNFKMTDEVKQAITAFIQFKVELATANLEAARTKKGTRKYEKRVNRYKSLLTIVTL
jgi:hypothetical protein